MKMITLMSSEKQKFLVPEAVAKHSLTIHDVIKDGRADNKTIRVTNVNSRILQKVMMYCGRHVAAAEKMAYASKPHKVAEKLKKWDAEFLDTDIDTLNDLTMAADSLNIPGLLDGSCDRVADILKDKSPEEVRQIFKIENEFTHTEEEEIHRENAWAYA
ncbi:hypothetical protein LUZ63_016740 [Rhynchospora breviuscula]|uniref:SKP1-like protein n=1 Tax=Rhynchospora breviuscula TaxID=2022672 RepID=A0A9Q0C0L9_9POAL|nr:hypothetical protein LUZ63_016740 [Rhynchospora breviuscula]